MNNEPVAWMSNGKEFYVQKNYCPDFIPLYTHPVKELTDEEIAVIGDKCFGTMSYELWVQTNEFARAILRNAQSNCNGFCGKYECRENQTECKRKASNK